MIDSFVVLELQWLIRMDMTNDCNNVRNPRKSMVVGRLYGMI